MASTSRPPDNPLGGNRNNHPAVTNDFVLFDEADPSKSTASWNHGDYPSRPQVHDKPSFTQYRTGTASVGPGSTGGESPFSSPASRLEDDFAGPSSLGSHGSGTLSTTTGLPNRKRQRTNATGHTSSSSISSLAGAMSSSGIPRSRSNNPAHHSPFNYHNQNLAIGRRRSIHHPPHHRHSIPGLSDLSGPVDDWNLADTSPQNPPSGSFGPLLGSLSLGGAGQEELLPSLFPNLHPDNNGDASRRSSINHVSSFSPPQSRSVGVTPSLSSRSLLSDTGPLQMSPTPAQEALARQQVRQNLAGVDHRALRGPLRALAQGGMDQQSSVRGQGQQPPLITSSAIPDPSQGISDAEMESALRAAVNDFVASTERGGQRPDSSARAPGISDRSASLEAIRQAGSGTPLPSDGNGLRQAQLNLLFPNSVPNYSEGGNDGNTGLYGVGLHYVQPYLQRQQAQSQQRQHLNSPQSIGTAVRPQRPPTAPRRRSNSFDASFLPASRPWMGQSPANGVSGQGIDTQSGSAGVGAGQGSGWTGPAIIGFDGSDLHALNANRLLSSPMTLRGSQSQGNPQRRPLTRDRSGLTVSPQETFLDYKSVANTLQNGEWLGNLLSNVPEGIDQVLAGGNSAGGVAGNGSGSLGAMKPQLLRGDTVKPSTQQQQQQQAIQGFSSGITPGQLKSDSSTNCGLSVFSPVSSDATPDTDDEDERVFNLPASADFSNSFGYGDLTKQLQQQSQHQPPQHRVEKASRGAGPSMPSRSSNHGAHGGAGAPRFLASSSSSSDSEDDLPLDADSRGFPRFNTGTKIHAFGPLPPPLLQDQLPSSDLRGSRGPPPPTRGRGLQGGYGYMPGSAESGLSVDPHFERARNGAPFLTALDTSGSNGVYGGEPLSAASSMYAMELSSGAQSQDDERLSPSIRSTAQVISPPHHLQQVQQVHNAGRRATAGGVAGAAAPKASRGGYPLPSTITTSPNMQRRVSLAASEDSQNSWKSEDEDEDEEESAADDSDFSNYSEENSASGGATKKNQKRVSRSASGITGGEGRGANRKGRAITTSSTKARKAGTSSTRSAVAQGPMYGHSVSSPESAAANTNTSAGGGGGQEASSFSNNGGSSAAGEAATMASGGISHHGHLTVCEYVSPLTSARCGTEFHRPYDLARHRETIHAKEEAMLIRQGKLTRGQCRVLYVEVDPEKSQATQEWKCDGRNGCGSVFSRKDALQRHRRLRGH